ASHPTVSCQFCGAAAAGSSLAPRFPVTFRPTGFGFSYLPSPAVAVGPPFCPADRAAHRPRRGFPVPHGRDPTGEGALCTPGPRCSHGQLLVAARRRRFPAADPAPALRSISGGLDHEASMRDRLRSPVRSSPCLWLPYGAGALGLFPRCFEPRRCQRRTSGWGRIANTSPKLTVVYMLDPPVGELTRTVRPRVATGTSKPSTN